MVNNAKSGISLTGVTQLKIGDVCWRPSVASETVLGVDNAKSGIRLARLLCLHLQG